MYMTGREQKLYMLVHEHVILLYRDIPCLCLYSMSMCMYVCRLCVLVYLLFSLCGIVPRFLMRLLKLRLHVHCSQQIHMLRITTIYLYLSLLT